MFFSCKASTFTNIRISTTHSDRLMAKICVKLTYLVFATPQTTVFYGSWKLYFKQIGMIRKRQNATVICYYPTHYLFLANTSRFAVNGHVKIKFCFCICDGKMHFISGEKRKEIQAKRTNIGWSSSIVKKTIVLT